MLFLFVHMLLLNESFAFTTAQPERHSFPSPTLNGTNITATQENQDKVINKAIRRHVNHEKYESIDTQAQVLPFESELAPAARLTFRRSSQSHDYFSPMNGNLANELNDENVRTIPFYISIADLEKYSKSTNSIPIIVPAEAQLTEPNENESFEKRKKNFSKIAQSLILATKYVDKKSLVQGQSKLVESLHDRQQADSPIDGPSHYFPPTKENLISKHRYFKQRRTVAIAFITLMFSSSDEQTRLKLFESGGYCQTKMDGLYDDPEDCENFIICYAERTFITKCAYGTLWNHLRKECDFPENGKLFSIIHHPSTRRLDLT